MVLTRESLQSGLMRDLWNASGQKSRCLSEEELDTSVDQTLAELEAADDPWVFGYGSLIWNPLLHYIERQPALMRGYHRRFCLWSRTGRGTPENPGLVLGLDRGGSCRGIAYRIDRAVVREEFRLLWRREMIAMSYCPKWIAVNTVEGEVKALAFVMNREHPNYAGHLSIEQTASVLATAVGRLGSARDYLLQTIAGLQQHGVRDHHLIRLRACIDCA